MHNAQLIENVARTLRKSRVRSVLVAVSGGADSVALLRICCSVAKLFHIRVEAVNCNFHLRGEESDRDSEFTAGLCRKLEVKLHSLSYDVEEYMRLNPGISTEMACRKLRYNDFFRIAKEKGHDRIAVAHNADDDIETMILNMLRGSGSRGLKGMDTDNGKIIRPLLSTSRREIEQYLESIGQNYITDSSNLTSDYRRNFIRREILPLLEQRWHGARKSLRRTVEIMKADSEIVENFYKEKLTKLSNGNTLKVYHEEITTGIILRFIEKFGGNATMAEEIMEACHKPFARRTWQLDCGNEAILERDVLVVKNSDPEENDDVTLLWNKIEMSPNVMKKIKTNPDPEIQYLPHGPEAYELRKPRQGDRIAPLGMKGTRLVSDVISDAKLDRYMKSITRVLVRRNDGEIIWVTGLKRSRHDLVSENNNIIFKVQHII